jgi:hypothetical protein
MSLGPVLRVPRSRNEAPNLTTEGPNRYASVSIPCCLDLRLFDCRTGTTHTTLQIALLFLNFLDVDSILFGSSQFYIAPHHLRPGRKGQATV